MKKKKDRDDSNLICRAVTLPVAEPINSTWPELRDALAQVWRDSTSLANWATTELAKADEIRRADDRKLRPMPKIYLYGLASKSYWGWQAWDGCYASAGCVLRTVEKKYRKARHDLLWRGSVSLPNYRYPYPYPVHNQNWEPVYIEGDSGSKVAAVKLNLAGKSFCLVLKSGQEFARQIAAFKELAANALLVEQEFKRLRAAGVSRDKAKSAAGALSIRGEASLYQQTRQGKSVVMLKMVGWFQKPAAKSGRTILVRTDPNALWVCECEGRQEWILNADEVRSRIEAHRCFLQRMGQDGKAERRCGGRLSKGAEEHRQKRCDKQNDYLDSKTHEFSAMLAKFAARQGAAIVIYDDKKQGYLPSFPWHQLRTKLGYKLEAAGVQFVHQDSAIPKEEECQSITETAELVRMTGRLAKRQSASGSHPKVSVKPATSNGSASRR